MICFGIVGIFVKKPQNSKNWKSGHNELLRRSVGNPCCGVNLRQGVGYLVATRPRCQNGTPQVRHGVATVHIGQNFGFFVPTV